MYRRIIMIGIILLLLVSLMGCFPQLLNKYTLSVFVTPQNSGIVSPDSGSYQRGSSVTITAIPATGWAFSHWSGDASGSANPYVVTMNSNKNIIAVFEEDLNSIPGIAGIVKDAYTDSALSGVTVNVYTSSSNYVTSGITDTYGFYYLEFAAGNDYHVQFSKAGYITVDYYGINVSGTTYLESVLQIDNGHSGFGSVSGKIIDGTIQGGTTGVGGVTINLRSGMNATTGPINAITTSDVNGEYSFPVLAAGNYTAELIKTGWATTYFSIVCIGGITKAGQNGTITPLLSTGETRIVLTWGDNPADLDSHLTGPVDPEDTYYSNGRFHIYYDQKKYEYYGDIQAELDVDDTDYYGPETTTIHTQHSGVYRYSVFDFTNRYNTENTALSYSGAQVKVYRNNVLVKTFHIPTGRTGTLWTVFEMNGNTIIPINTITYHDGTSYDINSLSSHSDAGLMKNMPRK